MVLERFVFYSLIGNFVLFLNSDFFGWRFYNVFYCIFIFLGILYVLFFMGGIIVDILFGKFKIFLLVFVIYFVGYVFLFVVIFEEKNKFLNLIELGLFNICGCDNDEKKGDKMSMFSDVSSKLLLIEENCVGLIFGILIIILVGLGIFRLVIVLFGVD